MLMKELLEARQAFYKQFLEDMKVANTTFNRAYALTLLYKNPYWHDIDDSMKKHLAAMCDTKTNWGKNLFESEVKICMLECLLFLK